MKTVLITGSAGHIGRLLARNLSPFYEIRGFDREPSDMESAVVADLGDREALRRSCDGADAVVHLAGLRGSNSNWNDVLKTNIAGTYNVYEAAKQAGVRKFVYASSCQVTFGYGEHHPQTPGLYPRSLSFYGVSKFAGEQLGHVYSSQHGIEVICIRLGLVTSSGRVPSGRQITGRFLGHDDATSLFRRAIDVIGVPFAVVYGASESSIRSLDLTAAREILGFIPTQIEDDYLESE